MQSIILSKSQFKPKALEYLRKVEKSKKPIIITHNGKPSVKIVLIEDSEDKELFKSLRGSVVKYIDPMQPVGLED